MPRSSTATEYRKEKKIRKKIGGEKRQMKMNIGQASRRFRYIRGVKKGQN